MTLPNSALLASNAKPRFKNQLHVGRPNVGDRETFMRRLTEILDRRWFTNDGVVVHEFEQSICGLTGVKHCIAMCNATVALEILARACGLAGEVILPSYTFIASAHALQWQGIIPVFADIDPATHTLDPACVERQITPRTTGIMGVHLWGRPCDVEGLTGVADRHNLTLIYDAAHAFGVTHGGQSVAKFGRASVFSFHATKFVNAFEGGAVVTDDDILAERVRLMRNFGFEGEDRVVYVGTNGKMTEVCAAMGLTSIESIRQFVTANEANYRAYRHGLSGLLGVRLLSYDEAESPSYQYIVLEIDPTKARRTRDELKQVLEANNVKARRYFWPGCHRMEPYKSLYPNTHLWLPETERVASQVLVLPTGTAVSTGDVEAICQIIRGALEDGEELDVDLSQARSHSISFR